MHEIEAKEENAAGGGAHVGEEHAHGACRNCGADLAGEYCHRCGQPAHVHRSFAAWWHELVHGVLHLDGKVAHTLPLLAWRPGELTRRYIEGERARFVSPLALFLFSVFLMFAVFTAIGGPLPSGAVEADPQAREEARSELAAERAELVQRRDRLIERRRALAATGEPTAGVDAELQDVEQAIATQDNILTLVGAGESEAAAASDEAEPEPELVVVHGADSINQWFEAGLRKAKENPSLLLYKLQANAYKFSWALIPLSVPFVWILFLHRRRYRREYSVYDHTVFVTYSIAFMSLGAVALALLSWLGLPGGWLAAAALLVPPVHIYRQLRGAYRLSRFGAAWRAFLLVNFAFVAGGFFFTLLLALGLLG